MENQNKSKLSEHFKVLIESLKNNEVALNSLLFVVTYCDSVKDLEQDIRSKLEKVSEYTELRRLSDSLKESCEGDL